MESVEARLKRANELQDACNPRGVARQLVAMIDEVCEERDESCIFGDEAVILVLGKLLDMAGVIISPETAVMIYR
jgi:hypothetical protein